MWMRSLFLIAWLGNSQGAELTQLMGQLGYYALPLRLDKDSHHQNLQGTMTAIGRVEVRQFRIGSFAFDRAFLGTMDLKSFGLGVDKAGKPSGEIYRGKPIEGMLGMDILARNLGIIDCVQHKLWLKKVLDP